MTGRIAAMGFALVLMAGGARACAVAEGCPMYEERPPPTEAPDCAPGPTEGGEGCVRPQPEFGLIPLAGLGPVALVIGAILARGSLGSWLPTDR